MECLVSIWMTYAYQFRSHSQIYAPCVMVPAELSLSPSNFMAVAATIPGECLETVKLYSTGKSYAGY